MAEKEWSRIAVVGAGAVGSYFGGMLARAGAPVTLIGRALHVEAINRDGLLIDSIHFKERISVSASTELKDVRDAQLVLFSVKTVDTEGAAKLLAPYLAPDTVVVSLQNGVDNAERIDDFPFAFVTGRIYHGTADFDHSGLVGRWIKFTHAASAARTKLCRRVAMPVSQRRVRGRERLPCRDR